MRYVTLGFVESAMASNLESGTYCIHQRSNVKEGRCQRIRLPNIPTKWQLERAAASLLFVDTICMEEYSDS